MSDQSVILRRAITLGEILDVEALNGMLHAEFRDPVSNMTIIVESTIHVLEIQPIIIYKACRPDEFALASDLLSEQDQHRLANRLSDHINTQNKGATPSSPLAETVVNGGMLVGNWWQ